MVIGIQEECACVASDGCFACLPEPACTCTQTDVDMFDASFCGYHNPSAAMWGTVAQ